MGDAYFLFNSLDFVSFVEHALMTGIELGVTPAMFWGISLNGHIWNLKKVIPYKKDINRHIYCIFWTGLIYSNIDVHKINGSFAM